MDAIVKNFPPRAENQHSGPAPTWAEVEAAVRTLLRWTGDNLSRGS